MKRRSFVKTNCTCGLFSLIPGLPLKSELRFHEKNKNIRQQINPAQVNLVFKFVDSTQTESVKESIFGKLGNECLFPRKLNKWIESFKGIDALIN